MATADEYAAWIVKNADKRGTPEFNIVAQAYRQSKEEPATYARAPDALDNPNMATEGMSGFDTTMAGIGKAIQNTGMMFASGDKVRDMRERDKPLMDTKGGFWGNIGGNVGMVLLPGGALKAASVAARSVPAMAGLAPGLSAAGGALMAPKSIGGALAVGGAQGLLQPAENWEERGLNTGIGAAASAALPVAMRAYGAAKSAAEPFYESGRNQILARALREASGGGKYADETARVLQEASMPATGPFQPGREVSTMGELVPGSIPTAAQRGNNASLAALERAAVSTNPAVAVEHSNRMAAQNAARSNLLQDMSGSSGALDVAKDRREAAVQALYDAAKKRAVPTDSVFDELLQRPAVADAMRQAEVNAANRGGSGVVGQTLNIPPSQTAGDAMRALPDSAYFQDVGGELVAGGKGYSLLQAIRKIGGINQSELQDITGEKVARFARAPVGLFNKSAHGLDELATQMHAAGYIPTEDMAVDGGVQWLRDAIRGEMSGNKVYAIHDIPIHAPEGSILNESVAGMGQAPHYSQLPGDAVYSGRALHELKLALDASRNVIPSQSANKAALSAVGDAGIAYNAWLDSKIPEYARAKSTYAAMSRPINQMETAKEIANRAINPKGEITFDKLARALTDNSAAKAQGYRKATLEGTMSANQMGRLNALKEDLRGAQFAQNAGRVGSNTVQNLAYSNMLNQAGIPNVMRALAPSQFVGSLMSRGGDLLYQKANQRLSEELAQALMSPKETAALMMLKPSERQAALALALRRGGASVGMMAPALLNANQ